MENSLCLIQHILHKTIIEHKLRFNKKTLLCVGLKIFDFCFSVNKRSIDEMRF